MISSATKEDIDAVRQEFSQIRKSLSETYKIMIEASTGVNVLSERFDRHLAEQKADVRNIYSKLDIMTENQHKNKEDLSKQIQDVNLSSKTEMTVLGTKVAMITSGVVSAIGLASHWLLEKVK